MRTTAATHRSCSVTTPNRKHRKHNRKVLDVQPEGGNRPSIRQCFLPVRPEAPEPQPEARGQEGSRQETPLRTPALRPRRRTLAPSGERSQPPRPPSPETPPKPPQPRLPKPSKQNPPEPAPVSLPRSPWRWPCGQAIVAVIAVIAAAKAEIGPGRAPAAQLPLIPMPANPLPDRDCGPVLTG